MGKRGVTTMKMRSRAEKRYIPPNLYSQNKKGTNMKFTDAERTEFTASLIAALVVYALVFVVLALGCWVVGANVFAVIGLFATLYGAYWCLLYAYKDATGRDIVTDAKAHNARK